MSIAGLGWYRFWEGQFDDFEGEEEEDEKFQWWWEATVPQVEKAAEEVLLACVCTAS